jgi:hypothetical protein
MSDGVADLTAAERRRGGRGRRAPAQSARLLLIVQHEFGPGRPESPLDDQLRLPAVGRRPPAITVAVVAGPAVPGALVEIVAVAAVPPG